MRKVLIIILGILLGIVGCQKQEEEVGCVLDGTQVCYDEAGSFLLEEGAVIYIGGLEKEFEDALIQMWDAYYPEYKGLIGSTSEKEEYDAASDLLAQERTYDIIYTSEEMVTYYLDKLRAWEERVYTVANENSIAEKIVSPLDQYFIPYSMDGSAFLYNKTMLEALGIDVESDEDGNGLPDSIDTWEEIFVLADTWSQEPPVYKDQKVLVTFPFSLNEMSLSYFMFTSNHFRLFSSNIGNDPGFNHQSFVKALGFIQEIGKHTMASKEVTTKVDQEVITEIIPYTTEEYIWQWEDVFNHEISPFGVVTPWMTYTEAEGYNEVDYVIAPFPTYQGTQQASFVSYNGFAMKANTPYPSATNAVMEFLRSEKVMRLFVQYTNEIPYAYQDHSLFFNDDRGEWMDALVLGDHISLLALPDNVYVSAMNGYYEIKWIDVLKGLIEQNFTPEYAASVIQERYEKWYGEQSSIKGLEIELGIK
ncbi:MAG: hypothetical protein IKL88_02185 [Erysipelotrichales bacterium]|nr:hypothetical protein [Erysipelotrichales bacterium]